MASLDLRSPNYSGITVTPTAAQTGGTYEISGATPGFWFTDVAAGEPGLIVQEADLVELTCKSEAASAGAKAYWNTTNNNVDKGSNKLIGVYAETRLAGPTKCLVILRGTAVAVGT